MVSPTPVPAESFLGAYARNGAFTDCYATAAPVPVTLAQFVEAFYTTRLFKIERWLLATIVNLPSTDAQASLVAEGRSAQFAAWTVEHRSDDEILLAAGRTRSWLCVRSQAGSTASTTLLFGSAIVPVRPGGELGLMFQLLLGFHRLYSRLLLAAAARRVMNGLSDADHHDEA